MYKDKKYYDEDLYQDLSHEHPNLILNNKTYVLPVLIQNHAVVEIFLTQQSHVKIESQYHPIRHGRICGSRLHLRTSYSPVDYNPKLIWNGTEWLLQTTGTFFFQEIEVNGEDGE